MSNGKEFQRMDAATGNERRPTVDWRKGGTWSSCVDDDRSRRRPGSDVNQLTQVWWNEATQHAKRHDSH